MPTGKNGHSTRQHYASPSTSTTVPNSMLFSLPSEVLALIFDHLVRCIGIHHSVRLRPVCRNFDKYILDAIYALPTFENLDGDNAHHLTWDIRMSKAMVAGLIRTKLTNHQEERALTREVLRTASFITTSLVNAEKDVYIDTLVHLAADNVPLYEIIRGLTRVSNPPDTGACLHENALAAALSLNQASHIQTLMNLGVEAQSRTKWFGDPLHIAASYTAPKTFLSIFGTALSTNEQSKKRLAASRLITALEHAATQGRADIFCAELWTSFEEAYDQSLVHKVFEPAITGATLACHDNVVVAIFDLLRSHNRNFLNASHDMYWVEVLRLAASNGSERIVQLTLDNTAIVNVRGSLNFPLEDACRTGRMRIVKLLIAYNTGHNLDSYAGSMYWAARGAHYDLLSLVVRSLARIETSCLGDALCGAAVHGASAMTAVYEIIAEWASVKEDLDLEGKTFAQIIDVMFKAGGLSNSVSNGGLLGVRRGSSGIPEGDIFQDLLSEEHLQLAQACRRGKFWAVYELIAQFGDEDTAASNYSAGAFSEAITHQHPGILQYLCEKFSRKRYVTAGAALNVRSTAIFQTLFDHGWSVDAPSSRLKPPILGNMAQSEELTRWFLNYGSNPNSRCDWDITPLSVAVDKASLSIIRLMLEHGGDTRDGQLLHFAMKRKLPDQLAVIDMLISFGAPLDARMFEDDPSSWLENKYFGMGTPLHKAVDRRNVDAAAHLLWRGASCEMLDTVGRTALDIARGNDDHEIVEMIESRCTPTPPNHSR